MRLAANRSERARIHFLARIRMRRLFRLHRGRALGLAGIPVGILERLGGRVPMRMRRALHAGMPILMAIRCGLRMAMPARRTTMDSAPAGMA